MQYNPTLANVFTTKLYSWYDKRKKNFSNMFKVTIFICPTSEKWVNYLQFQTIQDFIINNSFQLNLRRII